MEEEEPPAPAPKKSRAPASKEPKRAAARFPPKPAGEAEARERLTPDFERGELD